MKFKWDEKDTTNVITGIIILTISISMYLLFRNLKNIIGYLTNIKYILMPFILGGAMAYILNFFVKGFEKLLLIIDKKGILNFKRKRGISVLLTYIITFIFIFLVLKYIIPQFYLNIRSFINQTPIFIEKTVTFIRIKLWDVKLSPEIRSFINGKLTDFATFATNFLTDMIPFIATFATKTISLFLNIIMAIIISIYLVYDKENFARVLKKFMIAVFPNRFNYWAFKLTRKFDTTLKSYIIAKGIGSIVIGIVHYIILLLMGIEYALLFAFILGFTNLIPWFGSYLGAIPIFFVLLFTSLRTAIWFIIIVFVVGIIDANVISPRIEGKSVGISSFWVIFALLLGGSLFGIAGFLIAVPVFVVIYTTVAELIDDRLIKKGYETANPILEFDKKGE